MKAFEAINILQLNTPFVASKEANEAVEMAIESLKKEISVSREIRHGDYFCPKCGSNVEYQGYCHACGQRVY